MPSSRWKPRDPRIFPYAYADAVEQAFSTSKPAKLFTFKDRRQAHDALDHFREWRYCLRNSGSRLTRCFDIEEQYRITTKTVYIREVNAYSVYVEVKPKRLSTIKMLNPDLSPLIEDA